MRDGLAAVRDRGEACTLGGGNIGETGRNRHRKKAPLASRPDVFALFRGSGSTHLPRPDLCRPANGFRPWLVFGRLRGRNVLLSGFILTYAYTGRAERNYLNVSARTFWRARIARIFPAYFFGLLLGLPAFLYGALVAKLFPVELLILGLILVPSFMQAWWPPAAFLWNGPAWSLSVEFFFYALFPALARLTNCLSRGNFIFLAFALVVATALTRSAIHSPPEFILDPGTWWRNFEGYFPIFHLPQFVFGMALGRLYLFGPAVSPRLHAGMLYVGVVGLVVLFGFRSLLPHWTSWVRSDIGLVLLFSLVIFGGARAEGGLKMLACPALVLLGEASYSMYILHSPIHFWWRWLTTKAMGLELPPLADLALSSALIIGMSVVVYLYVERPLRRWIARPASPSPGGGSPGARASR